MNSKVSVIMPSLNVAPYISECVDSVMRQTLRDIEIICIDAGSTDGTLDILKRFAERDSRIQVLNSDVKSYGYQVNLGLKAAKSDYIAILETDDFIDANMYEQLLLIAESNRADFVRAYYYDHRNGKDFRHDFMEDIRINTLITGIEIREMSKLRSIWSALYKKEFLVKNNIDFLETPGASFQDTSFAFKIAVCAQRAFLTDKAFYHYRNDNPGSSVHSTEKVYCVCDEIKEVQSFIDKRFPEQKDIYELFASFRFRTYLWNYRRLKYEYQCEFLDVMHQEMLDDWNCGYLVKSNFKPHEWSIVTDILFNKEMFLWETSKLKVNSLNSCIYSEAISEELRKYNNVIIYGAGIYGKRMLSYLRRIGIEDEAIVFAVSKEAKSIVHNRPCHCIKDWINLAHCALVIIAVEGLSQFEMYENAVKLGFEKVLIMDNTFKNLIMSY
ncbi:MAG: glycosyltransferase [Peptococcaceae bacterium]|nr:glycosyltransferase [Peptococcaceae bacterium]